MKKIIAIIVALCTVSATCSAAEHKAKYNSQSDNIFIEGKLDNYNGGILTLRLYNGDNTCYIGEIEPEADGTYVTKFKFREDASVLSYDLKLNGVDVNDTVMEAYANTASFISADIFLTDGEGGGLRIDGDTSRMTYIDTDPQTYVPEGETAKAHTYEVTDLESYISADTEAGVCVYPRNELGNDGVGYTVILTQYAESGMMLDCKILKTNTMTYYDYAGEMIDCGKTVIADGAKTAKAFIWDPNMKLIPYAQETTGELEPISVHMIGASGSQMWNTDWMSVFPMAGIGSFLGDYFNREYVTFKNKAASGATAATFIDDDEGLGNWNWVMKDIKEGDYAIILLGANDFATGWGDAEKKAHKNAMETMINRLMAVGVTPVLVQTYAYGYDDAFDFWGPSAASLEVITELGEEYGLTVLPLGDEAVEVFKERGWTEQNVADKYHLTVDGIKEIIGEDMYAKYYAKGKDSTFEGDPYKFDIVDDKGHLNVYGADFYASIVAKLLKDTDCPLRFYLK